MGGLAKLGALAGGVQRRRKNGEGGAIEHHPDCGEPAPLRTGVLSLRNYARRLVKEIDKRIDEGISEKEIEQVTKAVRRSLHNYFPEVLPRSAANSFLRNKNCRKEDNKDADMHYPEQIFRRHAAAEKCANVNPEAENQAD